MTTGLIMGDRFNVKNVEPTWISIDDNSNYISNIDEFCVKNQKQPLSVVRMRAQEDIMSQLKENPDKNFILCVCLQDTEKQ